jgi:hypothetical protein
VTADHNILISIPSVVFICFSADCNLPSRLQRNPGHGPLEIIVYADDVTRQLDGQGFKHHSYADAMQLYASDKPSGVGNISRRHIRCTEHIMSRCASCRLQLNGSKFDNTWFGSDANLKKLSGQNSTLTTGLDVIQSNDAVRDRDVWLDSKLTLRYHITKVA